MGHRVTTPSVQRRVQDLVALRVMNLHRRLRAGLVQHPEPNMVDQGRTRLPDQQLVADSVLVQQRAETTKTRMEGRAVMDSVAVSVLVQGAETTQRRAIPDSVGDSISAEAARLIIAMGIAMGVADGVSNER